MADEEQGEQLKPLNAMADEEQGEQAALKVEGITLEPGAAPTMEHIRNTSKAMQFRMSSVGPMLTDAQEKQLGPDPDRVAPPLQFYTMMAFGLFITGSFAIVIPTSKAYVLQVGADPQLSGIVIGLLPFFTAIGAYPMMYLIQHIGIKKSLIISLFLNIIGNLLYGFAGMANSFTMIVIGRMLLGFGLLPTTLGAYITRMFGANTRSKAALIMGIFTGLGFAMGPLVAYVLSLISVYSDPATNGALTDATLPGFVSAIFNVFYLLMVIFIIVEPPMPKGPAPGTKEEEKPYIIASLVNCLMSFIPAVLVAAWEVTATNLALSVWGWDVEGAALYLAGINGGLGVFTVIIAYCLSSHLTDLIGMLSFFALTAGFSLLLIPWWGATASSASVIAVYSVGAVFVDTGLQNGKQFSWANITKAPPVHMKGHAFTWVMISYFTGRGVGAFVAPFWNQEEFGWVCFGGSLACCLVALASKKYILG